MKPGEPRRRVWANLSPKLYRDCLAQAAAEHVSHAAIVRQALKAYLTRPEVSPGRSWELDDVVAERREHNS